MNLIRFDTADAQSFEVTAAAGETILAAAATAGLILPSLCQKGSCGVCRATVLSGEVTLGDVEDEALPAELREAGGVLLCRTTADSDLRIALPYERQRVVEGRVPVRRGTITALDTVALDTVRVEVAVEEDPELGSGMQFEPGQFMKVALDEEPETTRAYSLANVGNWDGVAEFFVKLRPGGYFSEYLRNRATVGDTLRLEGPTGAFGLAENGLRPRWFVCGGTGLAPLLSMIRRMAEWADPQPVRLILGVETPPEVFGAAELAGLSLPGGCDLDVAVRLPDGACTGPVGTSVDILAARLAEAPEAPDIYLCGSPGFLDAATETALAAGVPADQVYAERILAN